MNMIPVPCLNTLRIPRLMEALEIAGYTPQKGITQVWIQPKSDPITQEELHTLQRLVGSVLQDQV